MRPRLVICFALFAFGALATGCQNTGVTGLSNGTQPAAARPDKKSYSPAEIWNGWVTVPSPGPAPADFEIVFTGNVTSEIPTPVPGYGVYDPFCPPTTSCPNSVKVTYDVTSDTTTAEWFGSTLYQNIPGYPNEVHFGILNGPGGLNVKCKQSWYTEWTFASAPPQVTPVLNPCHHKKKTESAAKAPTVFATIFVETSFSPITASNPATSGGWFDIPYTQLASGAQPKFEFTNPTSQTIYTADSGIVLNQPEPTDKECIKNLYCSENIKNLERLNYAGMPPPGTSSSPFEPMKYPPPSEIPPSEIPPSH
jgi:hypothetical protein